MRQNSWKSLVFDIQFQNMAGNNGEIRIKREIEDDDDPLSIVDGEYILKKSEFSWNILIMRYIYTTYWIHILL